MYNRDLGHYVQGNETTKVMSHTKSCAQSQDCILWRLFSVIHKKVPYGLATAFKLDLLYSLYLYIVYFILIPDRKFSKAQDLV